MQITIKRFNNGESYSEKFDISSFKAPTLLLALYEIKANIDATLTFSAGCKSGVCGSCAVRVNGREKLACEYNLCDGDIIEPLEYHKISRDLKVDKSSAQRTLERIKLPSPQNIDSPVTQEEEKRYRIQSDCILCDSCYSVCPVYAVNPSFLSPFTLSRSLRYINDSRVSDESSRAEIIENIQKDGVWDCTLCGECTAVCPQGLDPKGDIIQLRSESLKAGYTDPTFSNQSFGTPDFGSFGF